VHLPRHGIGVGIGLDRQVDGVGIAAAQAQGHGDAPASAFRKHQAVAFGEAVQGQGEAAEPVFGQGVDPCLIQHQIGAEIEHGGQVVGEGPQVGVVAGAVGQVDVQVRGDPVVGEVFCPLHGEHENVRMARQDGGVAVALMNVQIDDGDAPGPAFGEDLQRRDGEIVEDTVTGAEIAVGVVGAAGKLARQAEFQRRLSSRLPDSVTGAFAEHIAKLVDEQPKMATRKASEFAVKVFSPLLPDAIGGSADLTGSNLTKTADQGVLAPGRFEGRFIHYGIREHAMAAAMNGMALHGGILPFGGTFLVFSDYCRPAIRLSALMGLRVVYVLTHDSIGVGEDGPTHQPVEHLAALRAIPNLLVMRPADAVETAECWQIALESTDRPSALALSRQDLPAVRTQPASQNLSARGGYVLAQAALAPKITLIATGSEVHLALEARAKLEAQGIGTRVVSLPCWALFDAQPASYRDEVLGKGTVRIAIEAGLRFGWDQYVGETGGFVGMTGFGASAPAGDLYREFAITAQAVVELAKSRLTEGAPALVKDFNDAV